MIKRKALSNQNANFKDSKNLSFFLRKFSLMEFPKMLFMIRSFNYQMKLKMLKDSKNFRIFCRNPEIFAAKLASKKHKNLTKELQH